jgi:outer membrane lipoprotein-sorting protein
MVSIRFRWLMKRALIFLLPLALHAAPLPSDEASAYLSIVAASRPKQGATTVHFRETRTSPMLKNPAKAEGEMSFQAPDRFRRQTTDGGVLVSNGGTLWIYSPAGREAERYKLGSKGGDAFRGLMAVFNLQDVDKLFRFTVERSGDIHRVILIPKRRSERRMFDTMVLDIGPDKKLRHAWWSSSDGSKTDVIFSNERDAGVVSFEFRPPDGVKVSTPLGL